MALNATGQAGRPPPALRPGDRRQPGERAVGAAGAPGDFEGGAGNRVDPPAVGEAGPDLVLADSPRAPVAGLLIGEAQQVIPSAWRGRRPQAADEAVTVVVFEAVEQPAINDSV